MNDKPEHHLWDFPYVGSEPDPTGGDHFLREYADAWLELVPAWEEYEAAMARFAAAHWHVEAMLWNVARKAATAEHPEWFSGGVRSEREHRREARQAILAARAQLPAFKTVRRLNAWLFARSAHKPGTIGKEYAADAIADYIPDDLYYPEDDDEELPAQP